MVLAYRNDDKAKTSTAPTAASSIAHRSALADRKPKNRICVAENE